MFHRRFQGDLERRRAAEQGRRAPARMSTRRTVRTNVGATSSRQAPRGESSVSRSSSDIWGGITADSGLGMAPSAAHLMEFSQARSAQSINKPDHRRREGSFTFLPGVGVRAKTAAEEYSSPATPTSRGGRKFSPPPAQPFSPPEMFERLPSRATNFSSASGLVAPRMPPPGTSVDVETAAHARQAQVMRPLMHGRPMTHLPAYLRSYLLQVLKAYYPKTHAEDRVDLEALVPGMPAWLNMLPRQPRRPLPARLPCGPRTGRLTPEHRSDRPGAAAGAAAGAVQPIPERCRDDPPPSNP